MNNNWNDKDKERRAASTHATPSLRLLYGAACIGIGLLLPAALMAAQEKDPFMPYTVGTAEKSNKPDSSPSIEAALRPLDTKPLTSYTVVGAILSPEKKLGVIKAPDGRDYFVAVGDQLGKEGGIVEEIALEGISLKMGEEKVVLMVSNKTQAPSHENKP